MTEEDLVSRLEVPELRDVKGMAEFLGRFRKVNDFKDNGSEELVYVLFSLQDRHYQDPEVETLARRFEDTGYSTPFVYEFDMMRFDVNGMPIFSSSDSVVYYLKMKEDIDRYLAIAISYRNLDGYFLLAKKTNDIRVETFKRKLDVIKSDQDKAESELKIRYPQVQIDYIIESMQLHMAKFAPHAIVLYSSDVKKDKIVAELNAREKSFILFE